jgi:hypothetical protein
LSSDIETSGGDDLHHRLPRASSARRCCRMLVLRPALGAQLAEHAPGDPEQQQAARQRQPDDLEQLRW